MLDFWVLLVTFPLRSHVPPSKQKIIVVLLEMKTKPSIYIQEINGQIYKFLTFGSTNIDFLPSRRGSVSVWFPATLICVCVSTASLCTVCGCCHSCVSLSVLLSEVCCDWSKLEITKSSFLSASSSAPPLARAPWIPFLSSFFNWRLSRTKPGMQMMKEMVRRLRVRPRYATLMVEE